MVIEQKDLPDNGLRKLDPEVLEKIIKEIIDRIKLAMQESAGDIVMFGSYARGDAWAESDIDIMIFTDLPKNTHHLFYKLIDDIATDICIKYHVVPTIFIQEKTEFDRLLPILPFYQSVKREGRKVA